MRLIRSGRKGWRGMGGLQPLPNRLQRGLSPKNTSSCLLGLAIVELV